jgi:Uma2 family endonuclease
MPKHLAGKPGDTTMIAKALVTVDELASLADDGYRYELIAGELIRMTPAKPKHSWVILRFAAWLSDIVEARELGIVLESSAGYLFEEAPDTVLSPDVSFIRRDRIPPFADWDQYFRVIPDLVMEAKSPSERKRHIDRKVRLYLDHGVRLIVLVDIGQRQLTVHASGRETRVLGEGDEFDAEDVVPGFRFDVIDFFAPPSWLPIDRQNGANG